MILYAHLKISRYYFLSLYVKINHINFILFTFMFRHKYIIKLYIYLSNFV